MRRLFDPGHVLRSIAVLAVLFSHAATCFPAQQEAAITEDTIAMVVQGDPWPALDSARNHHLNGDDDAAWTILARIAAHGTDEQGYTEARRELSAYVLKGLDRHQEAFDTLQSLMFSRDSVHEAKALKVAEDAASRIDSIQQELNERDQALEWMIAYQERHRTELQMIIAIVGITLLGIIIFLLFDRKNKPTADKDPIETPMLQVPLVPSAEPADLRSNDPLDPTVVHAHIAAIAQHLGRNDTIKGAAHAAELSRFLRTLMEHEERGSHPAQHALVVIRQYLKLSSLLIGERIKYEVRAGRELMDRGAMVPTRGIIQILGRIVKRMADLGTPVLDVELVPGIDGTGSQCIITSPVVGDQALVPLPAEPGKGFTRVDQRIGEWNGGPAVLITIGW